jgi:hypothetical protein
MQLLDNNEKETFMGSFRNRKPGPPGQVRDRGSAVKIKR